MYDKMYDSLLYVGPTSWVYNSINHLARIRAIYTIYSIYTIQNSILYTIVYY